MTNHSSGSQKERKRDIHNFLLDQVAYTRGLDHRSKGTYAYTRTFMQGKARTCWKTYFWSMVFGPWYLNLWFWTMVSCIRVLIPSIGPWYWIYYGFGPWY